MYFGKFTECWRCKKQIMVYTWKGHSDYQSEEPPKEGRPPTVKKGWSWTVSDYYWLNECQYCGSIQGDFFLYHEPEGPFWIDEEDYKEWFEKVHGCSISERSDLVLRGE